LTHPDEECVTNRMTSTKQFIPSDDEREQRSNRTAESDDPDNDTGKASRSSFLNELSLPPPMLMSYFICCAEGEDRFDVSGRESKKKASIRNAGTGRDAGKQTARSSFMRDFVDSSFDEEDDDDATDQPVKRAVLHATPMK